MDWTNGSEQVTAHFTVKDCLTLRNWNRLATDADGPDFDKLTVLCQKLEEVRALLGCPINVHRMFSSKEYNIEQQILLPTGNDVHARSEAVDFDCNGHFTIQEVKDILEPKLEELGIRMEFGTTTWVHLDLHTPGPSGRYFHV
jgi:hypothetical protein